MISFSKKKNYDDVPNSLQESKETASQALVDSIGNKNRTKKSLFFLEYPVSIYYIFGNEFCERFCFYGLRAVLWIYLNEALEFSEDASTSIYHAFIFFAYSFSVVGAIISDGYIGKYSTILYLSLVYCIGSIVLSVTSYPKIMGEPPDSWGMFIGLSLIGIGTGGIKPCVSSFGGDQIPKDRLDLLASFFAFFYLSINFGSFISTFVTPLLRAEVGFWLAFGLPAALMLIALVVFWLGRNSYNKVPPGDDIVLRFVQVIKVGIVEKWKQRKSRTKVNHWLDRAEPLYGAQMVNDVKSVLRIIVVFIPLPCFWALFDQHSSRWIEQARETNRNLGSWEIQPDQLPTLNPLFVMILVPFFDRVLYPFCNRRKWNILPLRRMTIGMFIISLSFVIAGLVELAQMRSQISVIWLTIQFFVMTVGEILVSVSGLEFSYSQAPKSMKSVIMSIWLSTTALGNAFVAVFAEFSTFNLAVEFFFYAGLMLVFSLFFIVVTWNYRYVTDSNDDNHCDCAGIIHKETSLAPDEESSLLKDGSSYGTTQTNQEVALNNS